MHDTIEVELSGAEDDVLAALLNFGAEQRVGLVHLPQAVQHLGQLRRVDRLHRDLHHRLGVELEWPEKEIPDSLS